MQVLFVYNLHNKRIEIGTLNIHTKIPKNLLVNVNVIRKLLVNDSQIVTFYPTGVQLEANYHEATYVNGKPVPRWNVLKTKNIMKPKEDELCQSLYNIFKKLYNLNLKYDKHTKGWIIESWKLIEETGWKFK